jgi:tRNA (guanine37-N1)-methyltransferase
MEKRKSPKTLKEAVKDILLEEEIAYLRKSYDTVGDIAILEIPDELVHKEKEIANALLSINKTIKVVCKKAGIHDGEFRTQPLEILAGENRKEAEYKENNCILYINPEESYFSPRLSTERKRIMELVKEGEEILVMFSGVSPYPCVLGKNTKAKEIVAIEKNPLAHEYAIKNIAKNKLKNVFLFNGDVKDIVPNLNRKFDRILMPLPKSAEDFLDYAIPYIKEKGILHFYDFLNESEFNLAENKIFDACKRFNRNAKIIKINKCGQHAPRVFRICVDSEII